MGRGRRFSESYKREAAAKAEASKNISQTARELGISSKSLYRWVSEYGEQKPLKEDEATSAELAARVHQLEKQLAVREEQIRVLSAQSPPCGKRPFQS